MMNKRLLSITLLALSFTTFAIDTHITKCSILDDTLEPTKCSFTISFLNPHTLKDHMVIKESGDKVQINTNCSEELFSEDMSRRSIAYRVLSKREELLDPNDYANSYEISGVKVRYDRGDDSTLYIHAIFETAQFIPTKEEVILEKYSRWRAEDLSEEKKNMIYRKHLYSKPKKYFGAIFTYTDRNKPIDIKHLIKCESLSSNLTYVRSR